MSESARVPYPLHEPRLVSAASMAHRVLDDRHEQHDVRDVGKARGSVARERKAGGGVQSVRRLRGEHVAVVVLHLGDHPTPATDDRLKTGH